MPTSTRTQMPTGSNGNMPTSSGSRRPTSILQQAMDNRQPSGNSRMPQPTSPNGKLPTTTRPRPTSLLEQATSNRPRPTTPTRLPDFGNGGSSNRPNIGLSGTFHPPGIETPRPTSPRPGGKLPDVVRPGGLPGGKLPGDRIPGTPQRPNFPIDPTGPRVPGGTRPPQPIDPVLPRPIDPPFPGPIDPGFPRPDFPTPLPPQQPIPPTPPYCPPAPPYCPPTPGNCNPGHCFPGHNWNHHCPPVVLDCFRGCYGGNVCVQPAVTTVLVSEPAIITETVVAEAPPAPAAMIPQVLNGDTVTMMFDAPQQAEPGKAVLLINEQPMELQIVDWQANMVTIKFPSLLLNQPMPAALFIGDAQGNVIQAMEILIVLQ
ncbi:MAG: hypothetical protein R3C18_22865 [Planctomycetaceae bacterium]